MSFYLDHKYKKNIKDPAYINNLPNWNEFRYSLKALFFNIAQTSF